MSRVHFQPRGRGGGRGWPRLSRVAGELVPPGDRAFGIRTERDDLTAEEIEGDPMLGTEYKNPYQNAYVIADQFLDMVRNRLESAGNSGWCSRRWIVSPPCSRDALTGFSSPDRPSRARPPPFSYPEGSNACKARARIRGGFDELFDVEFSPDQHVFGLGPLTSFRAPNQSRTDQCLDMLAPRRVEAYGAGRDRRTDLPGGRRRSGPRRRSSRRL